MISLRKYLDRNKLNLAVVIAAIATAAVALRSSWVVWLLAHAAFEPTVGVLCYQVVMPGVIVSLGLFSYSFLPGRRDENPFFPLSVAMVTGLGFSQFLLWALYASSLFTFHTACIFAVLSVVAGVVGAVRIAKRGIGVPSLTWIEAICLCVVVAFSEGLFECLAGTPVVAWDAVVSWDKWAETIAGRCGVGRSLYGGYPIGIPLELALPYKILVPQGESCYFSVEHLLMSGFFQFFPLLLGVATLSSARSLRLNPFWSIALLMGNNGLLLCCIKYTGYVDVPLAASVAGAASVFIEFRRERLAAAGTCDPYGAFNPMRSLALFAAAFAVVFTKGNGFYLALLFSVVSITLERHSVAREEYVGIGMAIATALTYYLHQWTFGVWAGGAETSPFLHALPVMSSHADIVRHGLPDLLRQVEILGSFHGAATHWTSLAVFAVLALLVAISLLRRETRTAAVVVIVGMALWSYAGSYDARNMLPILPITALLVPITALRVLPKLPRPAGIALAVAVALLLIPPLRTSRFIEITSCPLKSYAPPSLVKASPFERQAMALKIDPAAVSFFSDSDFARRTAHVISASTAYRALPGKGVYPMQLNAYCDACPHDLAFASRNPAYEPPKSYQPIAMMKGKVLGYRLHQLEPSFVDVPADVALTDGQAEDGMSIWRIAITNPPSAGVVGIRVHDGDLFGARLRQETPETPLANLFDSVVVGDSVRIPFWCCETEAGMPAELVFSLTVPQCAHIDGVEECE